MKLRKVEFHREQIKLFEDLDEEFIADNNKLRKDIFMDGVMK